MSAFFYGGASGVVAGGDHSTLINLAFAVSGHVGFEATANKGAPLGYAPLDAASKVPTVNLGGAGAAADTALFGDQTWKAIADQAASILATQVFGG